MLHLTRVAYGADDLQSLERRLAAFAVGNVVRLTTRNRPKRHAELVGGSLFWIIRHRIVARCPIVGFEAADDGRTNILVGARAVAVVPAPRRSHQGWRYLDAEACPPDLDDEAAADLPEPLRATLRELGLT